ncbi:TetR/AcrR family transcriptional regulator [Nakamurella multipartita]|jgi:AcrR family transcriptional regulator|uniref:Transcriptional regulator, TetR family n=1 Tax=Nakamurella multipartita (strain ATCC 700099 / DSM 44233 / CIP 104796 / JCM 9543 / NBRC 105858 / Y-104) TaxID=479431 RepID=C8XG12_NAKMY|nr:TetR family transcriptional regulator [Nakamurella multipartita]ACV78123.1 transcriptional regulator, TetR family [Nakamurella multipartita DSM 44233]
MSTAGRRGPSQERGVLLDRIVTVARASFAEHGWAGTTLRAVAREAGVDSRLVSYYFRDKTALLQACLQPPPGYLERIAVVAASPLPQRGSALVQTLLDAWNDPATAAVLRSIILTAAHEPVALDRLGLIFRESMIGVVARELDDDERLLRAGLVASQLVGLAMTRYLWRLQPIADLPDDAVVRLIGPAVAAFLVGPLPRPEPASGSTDDGPAA